jgi:hypothetical protein
LSGLVAVDTNIALLLLVGSTNPAFLSGHKKLGSGVYDAASFDQLTTLISKFSGVLFLPNVLTEVSNQSDGGLLEPAPSAIRERLSALIIESEEMYIASILAAERREFGKLGLADTALLILCSLDGADGAPTLLTVDRHLSNRAEKLGLSVINYLDYLASS